MEERKKKKSDVNLEKPKAKSKYTERSDGGKS